MTLGKIRVEGDHFLKENNTEFFYVGETRFADFKRFNMTNGPEALVRPTLRQQREVADSAGYHGPIVNRVFRCSDPGNPFGQVPSAINFDLINPFLDMCAEYGIYVDWTQGDDNHSMMFGEHLVGLQDFHNKFTSYIKRVCFYETENEQFQNGEASKNGIVPPPSEWYLRDSGYFAWIGSEPWFSKYDLDFVSFHGDRTNSPARWPKWVCDLDDSLSVLRSHLGKPAVLKEPNKFKVGDSKYYDDPACARELGLRVSMGGVLFHHQMGLEGNSYNEQTKVAAEQYYRGIAGAIGNG